jgi:hypothetical protein
MQVPWLFFAAASSFPFLLVWSHAQYFASHDFMPSRSALSRV